MALGFELTPEKTLRNSVLTAIVVFVIALINNLPEGAIPTVTEIYIACRLAFSVLIAFYGVNKIIEKKKNGVKGGA